MLLLLLEGVHQLQAEVSLPGGEMSTDQHTKNRKCEIFHEQGSKLRSYALATPLCIVLR